MSKDKVKRMQLQKNIINKKKNYGISHQVFSRCRCLKDRHLRINVVAKQRFKKGSNTFFLKDKSIFVFFAFLRKT